MGGGGGTAGMPAAVVLASGIAATVPGMTARSAWRSRRGAPLGVAIVVIVPPGPKQKKY